MSRLCDGPGSVGELSRIGLKGDRGRLQSQTGWLGTRILLGARTCSTASLEVERSEAPARRAGTPPQIIRSGDEDQQIQHLLGRYQALHDPSPTRHRAPIGRAFFPHLISAPFHVGVNRRVLPPPATCSRWLPVRHRCAAPPPTTTQGAIA